MYNVLLVSVNLTHASIQGDGNCLPYAVLRSAGKAVSWEAAIALRNAAITHARSLPQHIQEKLNLRRPENVGDPMGNNLDHRLICNVWPIEVQAKYGKLSTGRLTSDQIRQHG